jgi:hypothetical protein
MTFAELAIKEIRNTTKYGMLMNWLKQSKANIREPIIPFSLIPSPSS